MPGLETVVVIAGTALCLLVAFGEKVGSPMHSAGSLGTARLALADDAFLARWVRIVAMLADTGKIVSELASRIDGRSAHQIELPPGSYVVAVHAFADADGRTLLGSKSLKLDVATGRTTNLALTICTDGRGVPALVPGSPARGGSTAGSAVADHGAASPAVAIDGAGGGGSKSPCVPIIHGVDTSLRSVTAKVQVDASPSAGGTLTYVWSGAGFVGAVVGGASAEIPTRAIFADPSHACRVLVRTADGIATLIKVVFDTGLPMLGVLNVPGTCSTLIENAAAGPGLGECAMDLSPRKDREG